MLGDAFGLVRIALLICVVVFCAINDVVSRRIPNTLSYTLAFAGLIFSVFCGWTINDPFLGNLSPNFVGSIQGLFTSFAIMFVIYSYTNSGAGDVKLAAGIGSFLGVKGGLLVICYAYISAACFAGCLIIWLFGFGFAIRGLMRFMQIGIAPENPEIEAKAKSLMARGLPLAPFFLIGTVLHVLDLLRFFPAR